MGQTINLPITEPAIALYLVSAPIPYVSTIVSTDRFLVRLYGINNAGPNRTITASFNDSTVGQITTTLNPFADGPTGPTGPQGIQGLTGPNALNAWNVSGNTAPSMEPITLELRTRFL